METLAYGAWSARVHAQLRERGRLPLSGTLELTHRCPLRCQHCYNNLPLADQQARGRELTLAEYHRILDEIAEAGCLWLLLTGGEIFARPDFFDIYAHAKRKGFLVTLFTNATMMTPAVADRLAAQPPFSIEVTLYGYQRATYEHLTGISGSFERSLRGVRYLHERGLPLKLKTVATLLTQDEVFRLQAFAEKDLGVEFRFDGLLNPRLDGSQTPLALRVTPAELVRLDLADQRRGSEWQQLAERSPARTHAPSDQLYHCGAGVSSFAVDPAGDLRLCVLSQQQRFSLRAGSFAEGWAFLGGLRATKRTRDSACIRCGLKDLCGMCPAQGDLHRPGAVDQPVEHLCHTAHLRARALGIAVPEHGACAYCPGGESFALLEQQAQRLRADAPDQEPLSRQHHPAGDSTCGGGCRGCA